ncbi:discoidin domain-containing protein [Dactylosporangium aurantiacum]|uniref:Discoidin domain-containing protein n=1 Tax=Dactylosporangium aurantiacum TaxID=35754 RepID=A0A9Q9IS88_9ACTN|nr:discoidin domain-containing protein [Dactylosporangium aurantiacum]MDG6103955.1 discoidin domain-containing protein [Dactylosporangium aurantiacum]UWZ58867.1 discoidin domain-containing protein [Dactylosporangium aurantiacum]
MLTRRTLLAAVGAAGGALALPLPAAAAVEDPVADEYHRLLLVHTRWVQQQWDTAIGAYRAADFRFAAVLGNAVLLTSDGYDAGLAGVDAATLRTRTLATIGRFAATNRLAGGNEWGQRLFWDSTFELYFVLAARLLWAELDAATRANVDAIARGQAAYAYGLGTGNDPLSGSWSPNGSIGGYLGDTKLEEMGVYAQAIAPGLAWAPAGDAEADRWRERFVFWAANASGLPAADRANPALVDGRAVSAWNVARNLHDTFIVENHQSANPHYQAELWRTAGRAAAHFLAAGKPLPQVLTRQPSGRELWATLRLLASDAGEPVMPMVADRYHLYGRDVLPLAFLAQVQGDPHAARAEADLAARLMPYLRYAPENRLTKFSGEEKYEPEARAELAIAYLFHRWRTTPVAPVTGTEFFTAAAGARYFGAEVGLTAHQSVTGFAAAVTKPGYVRFLWQPGHDNWFLDTRAPAFLPAQTTAPTRQWTAAYTAARDGVDATMTVLQTAAGWAGYATLPTGTVVYAGPGPSSLTLFNLTMPGVPGLDGSRTFTGSGGAVTPAAGVGDGGTDELTFAARSARHVRFLGRSAAGEYGYSLFAFEALDATGTDRARGRTVTASSADPAYPAANAVDGDAGTRWAVAREERGRADSWLAVDLGATVQLTGVRLRWEVAYATSYSIQTSTDGSTWTTAASAPSTVTLGAWAGIDGRAGVVAHGATGPITASSAMVTIPPATIIEGYPGAGTDLAAAAARRLPTGGPATLRLSDADGYLTLLNLSATAVNGAVLTLPRGDRLYRGVSVVRADGGLDLTASIPAATGAVRPARFTLTGRAPAGTRCSVADSHHVTITAPATAAVDVQLTAGSWSVRAQVPAGATIGFARPVDGPVTPTDDLARGRTTFPTSPLPAGMGEPSRAVDGNPGTSWRPGPNGRMVVDLGAARAIGTVTLTWTSGTRRTARVEISTDGATYTTFSGPSSARYVAVAVPGWTTGDAELAEVSVTASP